VAGPLAKPRANEFWFGCCLIGKSYGSFENQVSVSFERSIGMRKSAGLLGLALLLITMSSPVFADTKSVTGQLVDLGTYESGFSVSQYTGVHARACALEGFPVGILTPDGKVYQVTGEPAAHTNAKLVPHFMAKSVTITGDVTDKSGIATIAASDIK
jgi:hypothetical protein